MSVRHRVAGKHHQWLSQVDVTGIVLTEPALADAAPAGFRQLDKKDMAKFHKAREIWNLPKGMVKGNPDDEWCRFILEEMLELTEEYWLTGSAITEKHVTMLIEQGETIRPDKVLVEDNQPVMMYIQVPSAQSLDRTWFDKNSPWKASPTTKMERLLRDTHVELGLITNGGDWRLIVASPSETASWLTWTAQTWGELSITLGAFVDLLGRARAFAGPKEQVLIELIRQSRKRQLEVADQLGFQVREALRLFVHEIDRIDNEMDGFLLKGYTEEQIYEACVTLMMRMIFLLYAEENGLLPHGDVIYDESFGITYLLTELENQHQQSPELLKTSYESYARLLALFRLVHQGSPDPDIHVVEHGGHLFDPDRFPFLEGRLKDGSWSVKLTNALPVRDSVLREMLRSLKYAEGEGHIKQWVSYRTLAVEQIGSMYEGLLDVKLTRAPQDEPIFELASNDKHELATVTPSEMDGLNDEEIIKLISEKTGRAESVIENRINPEYEDTRIPNPGTDNPELLLKAEKVKRLIKLRGIIRPEGLYMTHGADRRATGTHYTPPELTEPIVRHTLEPLVYVGENGKLEEPLKVRTAQEILDLNVCDMAMGSGAFLVQAIRYLSARLLEAWDRAMAENPGITLTLPYAKPTSNDQSEHIMPGSGPETKNKKQNGVDSRAELQLWAKRYVATNCIYGVDINHLAVEMAKLSLWLETHSKDKPFTFIDHALKHGDSLVGVDKERLAAFSLDKNKPSKLDLFDPGTEDLIKHATELRNEIASTQVFSNKDVKRKESKLKEVDETLKILKIGGDLLLATFFGAEKPKQREILRNTMLVAYSNLANEWVKAKKRKEHIIDESLESVHKLRERYLGKRVTFHWELEFPETFNRGGFDAFIGNPPFIGGLRISQILGTLYLHYLKYKYSNSGTATDICAYIIRNAYDMINENGTLGFLATNTICQGDTRMASLESILAKGGVIYRAISSRPWPGEASLEISCLNITKIKWASSFYLNESKVQQITSLLDDGSTGLEIPKVLHENLRIAFTGSYVSGSGFTLTPEEANEIIENNEMYKDVIFEYVNGEDLTTRPDLSGSRYVINFFDWSLDRAKLYPICYDRILQLVKPFREKVNRKRTREQWWIYAEHRPGLYNTIKNYKRVLVRSQVSKYHAFAWQLCPKVLDQRLVVFALQNDYDFAILQSNIHEIWGKKYSATLETRQSYTPSDCFDTFPLPLKLNISTNLNKLGQDYYAQRSKAMLNRSEGLTKIYNSYHDQNTTDNDIIKLRNLAVEMDKLVLDAYGWSKISLDYDFYTTSYGIRYTINEKAKKDILCKLFELNIKRYQNEVNSGQHS